MAKFNGAALLLLVLYIVGNIVVKGRATSDYGRVQRDLPSSRCPTGFNYSVAGYSKCYAVLNDRLTWIDAQRRCRGLHRSAQLAIIMNPQEIQITAEILQDHDCSATTTIGGERGTTNGFWIGARRNNLQDCTSNFRWRTYRGPAISIQRSNWASGEPNCYKNREACAFIDLLKAFEWNDLWCLWHACPLCEVTVRT